METDQTEQGREQTLREYKEAIQAARDALDVMEKEIEEELGPADPVREERGNE